MINTASSRQSLTFDRREYVARAVTDAAHLLPSQGPIGVFIHHNTLHAFQHLPFERAVCEASSIYGTEPFLREEVYREHLRTRRIHEEDIEAILDREPTDAILPGRLDRRTLRKKLLIAGQRRFEPATVQWHLEETGLLHSLRPDADRSLAECFRKSGVSAGLHELFRTCEGLTDAKLAPTLPASRPRDTLLQQTGIDLDEVIHPLLIRLAGAFLDQGMSYWPMPNRQQGFLRCARQLLMQRWAILPEHLQSLGSEFRRQSETGMDAPAVVISMLEKSGLPEDGWGRALQAELLALPGWAGIMHQLELEPELAPYEPLPCSLMEFLAVRLTLGMVAAKSIAASGVHQPESQDASGIVASERLAQASRLFDAFQLLGISTLDLTAAGPILRQRLVDEIQSFDGLERRRILHLAYELRHELDVLGPLSAYRRTHPPVPPKSRPSAQVFFCIDEREESTRRHLEEIAPDIETHSAAGFFGAAMDYAGIDDAHGVPLCPVVIKPQHAVRERPVEEHSQLYVVRRRRRKLMARLLHGTFVSSRSLLRGSAATAGLGLFAILPLVARVFAPRHYGRAKRALLHRLLPQPRTELNYIRNADHPQPAREKLLPGFSTAEKIDRVAAVLGPAGLHEGFARLVVVLGHGSTSWNNPHESAHDCGACGGRRGGPNGRTFAAMANRPEVREGLVARGIRIPADTWFIGGYHDTCNDDVDLYDLDCLPETHREDLKRIRTALNSARRFDAMERARRFEAARPDGDPDRALSHVQERADHLSEPRPEYGHATNAVCIIGRRQVTRGLFLDRRAFLISYDAARDPEDRGLTALLGAAGPVCAGISLEYYFSNVDNEGYGCGTKLPHNITGLIGVMNGHASDLRTGLPLQMVEVHEPVRILFVVETTPERLMRVISANPGLLELVDNRWVRFATLDPDTGEVHMRRDRKFEKLDSADVVLPSAPSSVAWFRGKLQHLPIVRITGKAQA